MFNHLNKLIMLEMPVRPIRGIIFDQAGKELSQIEISMCNSYLFVILTLEIELQILYAHFTLLLIGNFRADIAKSRYSV